ncbi:MAG TPA: hypothetical protein VML55_16855, partial [Planctomycetaceae bacterium]|nr:hypothetical protein [Planctomycetaceae bacterium]
VGLAGAGLAARRLRAADPEGIDRTMARLGRPGRSGRSGRRGLRSVHGLRRLRRLGRHDAY